MNKSITLLALITLISFQLFGQGGGPNVELKGIVVDRESNEPLSYTTVTLFSIADSSLVTGGISDELGQFSIPVKSGKYRVVIQSIAYTALTLQNVELARGVPTKDLGTIKLSTDTKTLDAIVIQGEKSQMELSLDKRVFNVSKDLSNMGGTAADIMNNLPSVQVDLEGNVSLRGSDNVQILIDGKPSGLVGMNGSSGLRQLQGSIIERIEVITNPSSRYDAEGMGGIINIVLKKDKENGMNGSFDITAGYPAFHGASANMNFRRKNVNYFVNYGMNYRNTPGRGVAEQRFFLADSAFNTSRRTNRMRESFSNNIRVGMDLSLNDKNTLSTSLLYRTSVGDNTGTVDYRDFTSANIPINNTLRTDLESEKDYNLEYNINYKRYFAKEGRLLTADVQYRQSNEVEGSDFIEVYSNEAPNLEQRSDIIGGNRNILTQIDYIQPFAKSGKLEIGYRGTFRSISNDYLVEQRNDDGNWRVLDNLTNDFVYDENVIAFYAMLGNKIEKISYQLGLRSETTDLRTDLRTTGEINDKQYTNLFPSAFFTYDLSKQSSVQVSYSRRLRRPGFRELNPFSNFTDARNIRIGNPDLDPAFTDSYELGYLRNFTNAYIYLGGYYRYSTDVVQRISTVNEQGVTFTQPINLGNSNNYGVEFNGSVELADWWKVNGNFNFFRNITEGSFGDQNFNFDTYSWWTRLINRMTIKKTWEYQISLNYRAPQDEAQGRALSMYSLDMGLTRDVLKKNGTVGVSVRDLFNTQKWRSISEGPNFTSNSEFQWRARQFLLNFTYRLNQKKSKKPTQERSSDFDDEF